MIWYLTPDQVLHHRDSKKLIKKMITTTVERIQTMISLLIKYKV
ncbi:MAG: hypothetical protein ACJ72R_06155 [Nitrososphaeraceae archaeon]